MALTVSETWESGSGALGRESSDEYSAHVIGDPVADKADDPATIMLAAIPKFSIISALGNILNTFRRVRNAPGAWIVTAEYKSPTYDRQTNDASFSFTVGGGSQHITHSLKTVNKYPNPNNTDGSGNVVQPRDYKGCIGVDQVGGVAGTDIDVTTFDFKTTFYVSAANLNPNYVAQLKSLRGQVNSDTVTITVDGIMLTFDPGELRYRNADGSKRIGFGDWEFTLNWSAQANLTNLSIGPITGIAKNGWDYLWVYYQPQADTTANATLPVPIAAYVEQVYTSAALSGLLLQTKFGATNSQGWLSPPQQSGAAGLLGTTFAS